MTAAVWILWVIYSGKPVKAAEFYGPFPGASTSARKDCELVKQAYPADWQAWCAPRGNGPKP